MKRQVTTRTSTRQTKLGWKPVWGFGIGGLLALRLVGCSSDGGQSATPGTGGSAAVAVCGNNIVDPGETCDGTTQVTCATATMNARTAGVVTCSNVCQLDASGCQSAGSGGASGVAGSVGTGANGGIVLGSGGVPPFGSGGVPPFGSGGVPPFGSGGALIGGGTQGAGGTSSGGGFPSNGGLSGFSGSPSGGTAGSAAGAAGASGSSGVLGDVDALRQTCVDTINMYRAMKSVAALTLAPESVEMCSDQGAQSDGTTGVAHGSAGKCPGMGAQDTCPGWPPQQYGGAQGALKACLMQMWNEGEPPEGRSTCISEYRSGNIACFEKYGHYLNMSDPSNTVVSCGFFVMSNGSLWMNQDLGTGR